MKITILDAETLGSDVSFNLFDELGETVIFNNTSVHDIENNIADSDVVILNKIKLNESNLKSAENLKLICVAATGYDNIDLAYCKEHGIAVCNVVGYSTNSVSQLTLAMALALSVNLKPFCDFVNDGSYSKSGVANKLTPVYHELSGKTWGIIGLGNIGKQVGAVAKALGCNVIGFKRTPDDFCPCFDLEYIFKNSDIVSVHLPLSDETRGIINKDLISKMKENAIFINVARGAVTDEKALADAVKSRKIAGLGVDVYSVEPFLENHPFYSLLNLPNVCLTPHMAWGSYEARVRVLEEIKKNINSFLNGEKRNRLV